MSDAPMPDADESSDSVRPTVYLHIGTFKSGTSYLQHVLLRNRDKLWTDGVLFPTGDRRWGTQVRAVRDVLGMRATTPSEGAWDELVTAIRTAKLPKAIVSMEFLSMAKADVVRRIVDDFRGYDIQVILGARDLVRVMPSAWQSMIKQGHRWSFDEFVASVTSDSPKNPDPHRRFWLHHDLDHILEVWSDEVGEDHVSLLIVPPSSAPPTLLWERFCSIVGLDASAYDASQDQNSNFSLSYSDTELMRRINVELRPELDRMAFKRWATRIFANKILRADDPNEAKDDRAGLGATAHDWAQRRSEEMVQQLRDRHVHVVGDLDELIPRPLDPAASGQSSDPKVVYPDAAVTVIAKLVKQLAQMDPEAGESGPGRRGGRKDEGGGGREGGGARRRGKRREAADGDEPAAATAVGRGRRGGQRRRQNADVDEPEWGDEVMDL